MREVTALHSRLFVWFSGLSCPNTRASVIAYSAMDESEEAWYASRSGERGSVVERVKGVDRETAQCWFLWDSQSSSSSFSITSCFNLRYSSSVRVPLL